MVAMRATTPPPPPPLHSTRILIGSLHEETNTSCQDAASSQITPSFSLHAVLDGHGPHGTSVAQTALTALLSATVLHLPLREKSNLAPALHAAFATAAKKVDASPEAADSGTTASVVIVAGRMVAVGNVGDSTVVWARGGREAVVLTESHRPDVKMERERVERVGGVVQNGYLGDGEPFGKIIGVTRALGDLDVRRFGVVATPFVRQVGVEGGDFLVLATDGLWDAHGGVAPQRVVDVVRECLEGGGEDGVGVGEAVERLVDLARGRDRLPIDDVAIVVVRIVA